MGTLYKIELFLETDNYEGSGIEGKKIWSRLLYTRARSWEVAMDTFRKRIGRLWGLPYDEDNPDRYMLQMSAYGVTHPALDMTRAIKKRLRHLADLRAKRRLK